MKTLVIESTPMVARWAIEHSDSEDVKIKTDFRLTGRNLENSGKWLWTCADERLSAFEDQVITVSDLWGRILSDDNINPHSDIAVIVDSLAANIGTQAGLQRVVFVIPEYTSEIVQNALIFELGSRFAVDRSEVYLLWRTVALVLSEAERTNKTCLVFDYGHFKPEGSSIDIEQEKGINCPVRDFSKPRGYGKDYSLMFSAWLQANYGNEIIGDQIKGTPFETSVFEKIHQKDKFQLPTAWKEVDKLHYIAIDSASNAETPVELEPALLAINPETKILWHGWSLYRQDEAPVKRIHHDYKILDANAVIRGGIIFASRHRQGKPTYFEFLNGYEIWCLSSELGLPKEWKWETLIQKKKILGTDTLKAEPNERFELTAGTLDFALNVRIGKSEKYRFINQKLPVKIVEKTPIVIHSEIRPTGGSVKITIQSKDNPDLFGQNTEVVLNWDKAEEKLGDPKTSATPVQNYGYPFIIQSSGDEEKRGSLQPTAQQVMNGQNIDNYLNALDEKMVTTLKNKFIVPFGNRKIEENLPKEIEQLIAEVNDHVALEVIPNGGAWQWVRLAGCLFYYASEDLQNAVFKKTMQLNIAQPDYAYFWSFGRICRKPQQFEEYLKMAINNWSNLAGFHYKLFWVFQKSLSCYGETARIDRTTAVAVFRCICEMLGWLIAGNVPTIPGAFGVPHWQKWTLLALLFGLRIREVYPDFLFLTKGPKEEMKLAQELCAHLGNPAILKTKIPTLAARGVQGLSLGKLVLRFLKTEAKKGDLELAGGIALTT